MGNRGIGVGFVYVMTHWERPGECKVGYTMHHPQKRAKEISRAEKLSGTCDVQYYIKLLNPYEIEQLSHSILRKKLGCIYSKSEWFDCTPGQAILGVKEAIYMKCERIPGFFIENDYCGNSDVSISFERALSRSKNEEIYELTKSVNERKRIINSEYDKKTNAIRSKVIKEPSLYDYIIHVAVGFFVYSFLIFMAFLMILSLLVTFGAMLGAISKIAAIEVIIEYINKFFLYNGLAGGVKKIMYVSFYISFSIMFFKRELLYSSFKDSVCKEKEEQQAEILKLVQGRSYRLNCEDELYISSKLKIETKYSRLERI